jgi:hypothetical protein
VKALIAPAALIAILSLAFGASGQVRPTGESYVVSGVVVREGNAQPLKRVHVSLTDNEHPERQATLVTGQDGHFRFVNVPRGKFTLAAEYHGSQVMYQQDGPFSTGIVTGPGLDSEHIKFEVPPSTGLTVKVLDEEGEPVRNAQIYLIHQQVENGWAQTVLSSSGTTDAGGVTHFAHLEPGTYYAAAFGRPWFAQNQARFTQAEPAPEVDPALQKLDVAYPLTYYGNTQTARGAVPIRLEPGEAREIEIDLRAVQAVHINFTQNGTTGDAAGANAGGFSSGVHVIGPGGVPLPLNGVAAYGSATQFGLSGFAPGEYLVSLSQLSPQGQPQSRFLETMNLTGDASVPMVGGAPISVSGTLKIEGEGDKPQGIVLMDPVNGTNAWSQVAQDGSFHFQAMGMGGNGAVLPKRYEIGLNSNDLYIRSVEAKGANYTDGILDVRPGATVTLAITAAKGLMDVEGIALTPDQKPASGAMVLLVPQDPASGLFVPRDQSDSDGTFKLQRVHPGKYYLLAIDRGRGLVYHDRAQLKPYLAKATPVSIPLAPGARLEAEVQPRQR